MDFLFIQMSDPQFEQELGREYLGARLRCSTMSPRKLNRQSLRLLKSAGIWSFQASLCSGFDCSPENQLARLTVAERTHTSVVGFPNRYRHNVLLEIFTVSKMSGIGVPSLVETDDELALLLV